MSVVDKISDYIGIEKIISFIEELIWFYLKPFKFFKNFFSRSLHDKIIQTLFYTILFLAFEFVLIDEITIKELIKEFFFEIALLFYACLVLATSDFIISKVKKEKSNFENILFFVILTKLLIVPLLIIFFELFTFFENYNFYLLANLVVFGLFVFTYIFSAVIFNEKIKVIFFNILLNIVLLNLVHFGTNFISINKNSTPYPSYLTDLILIERMEIGETLFEGYNVPNYRIIYIFQDNRNQSHFIFASPIDSIASGSFEISRQYHKNIKQNIVRLDTIIPNLQFDRNKIFFTSAQYLYKSIDSLMSNNIVNYTPQEIEDLKVYMINDSVESYKEVTIRTPNRITHMSHQLLVNQIETEQMSYNSIMPQLIIEYFYPIILLTDNNKNAP